MNEENKVYIYQNRIKASKKNIPFSIFLLAIICIAGIVSGEYYILISAIFPICFIFLGNVESYVQLFEDHMTIYKEYYGYKNIFKKKKKEYNIYYKNIEKIDSFFDTRWSHYCIIIHYKSGYNDRRLSFYIRTKDYNKFKKELQLHYINIL